MIAIVYPQLYGVGGIARYLDSLLSNLPPRPSPVMLITGDSSAAARAYRSAEILNVPLASSRFDLAAWSFRVRGLLRQLYDDGRISLVNLHWPPLIPGLFLPKTIPLVLTAHTTYRGMSGEFYGQRYFPAQWSETSLRLKVQMERRILARSSRVITLTEQGRQEIQSYGFTGPIDVVPNGTDIEKFVADQTATKDIDVLFSGRVELRKGSAAIAPLCKALMTARPNLRICVVGYGDDEEQVLDELRSLGGNIEMAGKQPFDRMLDYYKRSRVYVSTSYYEGLPGTCLEAMAAGLPAVVWDFPFYRDLVVAGVTGHCVPANDFDAMSRRVLDLLRDEDAASAMGAAARRLVENRYDWKKLAPTVLDALEGGCAPRTEPIVSWR